jgi:hypothetical protein
LHGAETIRELPLREDMGLKRIVVLAALLVAVSQSAAMAQERGPLVMRAEFEWTIVGIVSGLGVGALVWLTDPGRPGNNLSDNLASGAAWGSILGAGFGIYVLQRSVVLPATAVVDPLDPRNRISADPVAVESGQSFMLARRDALAPTGREFRLPLLDLRF